MLKRRGTESSKRDSKIDSKERPKKEVETKSKEKNEKTATQRKARSIIKDPFKLTLRNNKKRERANSDQTDVKTLEQQVYPCFFRNSFDNWLSCIYLSYSNVLWIYINNTFEF